MEKKVSKKVYEIPEDELRRFVISKIPRVRPQGEKPRRDGWLFSGLMPYNCEVCGEMGTGNLTQCPYCGRWVGSKVQLPDGTSIFKRRWRWIHENCFDTNYGCCKVCAEFIKENCERFQCPYCGTLYYRFQDYCPICGAPQKKPS